jgi:type IX secretion system PorP/SprF family membrane protein
MTKKTIKYSPLIILLLLFFQVKAQQDPQFTQYMYNMSTINPGYATDSGSMNFGALYRSQWVGSVGGPTTGTFFGHAPLAKNVEVGVSIVHDEIGDVVKESSVFADFAYVVKINETNKISFGLKAGASFFSTNFNGFVYSDDLPDTAFANNLSKTFPNIGVGTFYYGENYYVGLSSPNLLSTKHLERQEGVVMNGIETIHYFLTGGYVFNLNENLKFKPAFMARSASGVPLAVDITSNFLINNKVELGVGYRVGDAVSGLANFRVTQDIRIGYAYDYTLSNLGRFSSGSHEIMVLFDISKNKDKKDDNKGYDKSPRFF